MPKIYGRIESPASVLNAAHDVLKAEVLDAQSALARLRAELIATEQELASANARLKAMDAFIESTAEIAS